MNISRPSLNLNGPQVPSGDPSSDPASAQAEEQLLKVASLIAFDLSKLHKDITSLWENKVRGLLLKTMTEEEVKRVDGEPAPFFALR